MDPRVPSRRRRVRVELPRGRAQPPWVGLVVGLGLVVVSAGFLLVSSVVASAESRFPGPARFPAGRGSGLDPAVFWFAGLFVLAGTGLASWSLFEALRGLWARPPSRAVPWLADHRWRHDGALDETPRQGRRVLRSAGAALALVLCFAAVSFTQTGGATRTIILSVIALFGAVAVGVSGWALLQLLRAARHGRLELRFAQFPFFVGEVLEAELVRPAGAPALAPIEATLRCIQETRQMEGSGDDLGWTIRRAEVWSETRRGPGLGAGATRAPLLFQLPRRPDLATELSVNPPRYWELEVRAESAGLDLDATFLVPVYARPWESLRIRQR